MPNILKFLQANLGKCPPAQQSLLNDENVKSFGAILVSEPHCPRIEGKVVVSLIHHRFWEPFYPSVYQGEEKRWAFRSMTWVNKTLRARQMRVESSDITAAVVELDSRTILLFSVYVPPIQHDKDNNEELDSRLRLIEEAYRATKRGLPEKKLEVFIAGDFNRWDQMWSGTQAITRARQGEADSLIRMMKVVELQLLTPQGLETFLGLCGLSTIDLAFASEDLVEDLIKCKVLSTQHGSDHQAVETHFNINASDYQEQPRRLYKSAPWGKIREKVGGQLSELVMHNEDVTNFTTKLLAIVTSAVQELVPLSKPFPYAKRWWTEDLSQLRSTYTYWRNQARNARRHSTRRIPCELENKSAAAKQNFFKAVRVQKKRHWLNFLDDVQNI